MLNRNVILFLFLIVCGGQLDSLNVEETSSENSSYNYFPKHATKPDDSYSSLSDGENETGMKELEVEGVGPANHLMKFTGEIIADEELIHFQADCSVSGTGLVVKDGQVPCTSAVLEVSVDNPSSSRTSHYRFHSSDRTKALVFHSNYAVSRPGFVLQIRQTNDCRPRRESLLPLTTDRPSPPEGPLEVTDVTQDSAVLSWKARKEDESNPIKRHVVEKMGTTRATLMEAGTATGPTRRVLGRVHPKSYISRVMAGNEISQSHPLKGQNSIIARDSFEPPSPPGKPRVTDWGDEFVDLIWSAPSDDGGSPVTGYIIQKKEKDSNLWTKADDVRFSETEAKVYDLRLGLDYEFRIVAVNKGGESSPSESSELVTVEHRFHESAITDVKKTEHGPNRYVIEADLLYSEKTRAGGWINQTLYFSANPKNDDRSKRDSSVCFRLPKLPFARQLCEDHDKYIKCVQDCNWGYTLYNGKIQTIICQYMENVWRPAFFYHCKSTVVCEVELVSEGSYKCVENLYAVPSYCVISCESKNGNEAVPPTKYSCDLEGQFHPDLPFCATNKSRKEIPKFGDEDGSKLPEVDDEDKVVYWKG